MNEATHIEVARETDAAALAVFAAGRGLTVIQDRTAVETQASPRKTAHAISAWLAESGLPLVPTTLGERELALRPPSG